MILTAMVEGLNDAYARLPHRVPLVTAGVAMVPVGGRGPTSVPLQVVALQGVS